MVMARKEKVKIPEIYRHLTNAYRVSDSPAMVKIYLQNIIDVIKKDYKL